MTLAPVACVRREDDGLVEWVAAELMSSDAREAAVSAAGLDETVPSTVAWRIRDAIEPRLLGDAAVPGVLVPPLSDWDEVWWVGAP